MTAKAVVLAIVAVALLVAPWAVESGFAAVAVQLALQAAPAGFPVYVVFDLYNWTTPYPTQTPVLRTDVYLI